MIIINAKIYTMIDKIIENGYIHIKNGKIFDIGDMNDLKKIDDEILDISQRLIFPGFIDPHCHLGMWEDAIGFEGADGNEDTDPITPNVYAIDAINPMDRCFKEAVESGVTTVVTGPGSCNPIAGNWIAIKTYGDRIDDMIVKNPVGMKFALGENPKTVYSNKNMAPVTRMGTVSLIKEQLEKTLRYMKEIEKSYEDKENDLPDYDAKCESLIPVLKGDLKAFVHAHRADDIFTAIRLCKHYNINYVIVHGTEAHLIVEHLKKDNVSVITGPFLSDRSKPELKNLTPSCPGILSSGGVEFAICTDHPVIPIQYLNIAAGVAKREGLSEIEALKSITISAAKICGIDDRVGSIEIGKDADFVVFNKSPLSIESKPYRVIILGKIIC